MKILYAASEATPFAKSGGLADVAGSLPKALVKDGVDARVIMPLYGDLKMRDKLEYVTNYSVPVGWRSQYCGLFKAEVNGVTYYFLDNEYYFKRRGLYGFYDDGERFAFFSRAVLETLFYIDFTPDIINCNDWQTALVPVYLNLYYRHLDKFNRIKTIFTNSPFSTVFSICPLDTCNGGSSTVAHGYSETVFNRRDVGYPFSFSYQFLQSCNSILVRVDLALQILDVIIIVFTRHKCSC